MEAARSIVQVNNSNEMGVSFEEEPDLLKDQEPLQQPAPHIVEEVNYMEIAKSIVANNNAEEMGVSFEEDEN